MAALVPDAVYTPLTDSTLKTTAKNSSITSRTLTKTFTAGQILVAVLHVDTGGATSPDVTDSQGLTWTRRVDNLTTATTASSGLVIWTSTPVAAGSVTLTHGAMSADRWAGLVVYAFPSGCTIGATDAPAAPVANGVVAGSITTTGADSCVVVGVSDWTANTNSTHAWTGTVTETYAEDYPSAAMSAYDARMAVAAASALSYGLSAPSNVRPTMGAVEIKQAAGGGGGPLGTVTRNRSLVIG